MTCRELAPPDGFIAFLELMRDLHSLRRSGLRPAQGGTTMPSADLCLLPLYVAIQGAFRTPDDRAHPLLLTRRQTDLPG